METPKSCCDSTAYGCVSSSRRSCRSQFDSSPNKLEIPEEFEAAERQIKALAGAEFSFKLRPTGEVDDLKIPDQTLKNLREGAGPGRGRAGERSPNRA